MNMFDDYEWFPIFYRLCNSNSVQTRSNSVCNLSKANLSNN